MSRRTIVLAIVVLLVVVALAAGFCLPRGAGGREGIVDLFEIFPSEDRLVLKPAAFQDLAGWRDDAVEAALPAFLRSCQKIAGPPGGAPPGRGARGGGMGGGGLGAEGRGGGGGSARGRPAPRGEPARRPAVS